MMLLWLILNAVNIDAYTPTYRGDIRKYHSPKYRISSIIYDDIFLPHDDLYSINKQRIWRSDNSTVSAINLKCDEYRSKSDQFENFIPVDLLTKPATTENVYRELHVSVKAFRGVRILLSSAPEIDDPLYVIAIGVGNNRRTEVRNSAAKNTPALKTERTPGILSPFEFRHFYIRIYLDGLIEFGRIDGPPIIQYKGLLRNSLQVNFASFASWRKLVATIQYNCPDPSLFHCDEIPDEEYDRCGNQCERHCTDFMKKSRRECEDTCDPGCRCKRGFRRDESGRCIPEYLCHNYCDQTEDFHECGILCETFCENIGPKPEVCDNGNKPSKDFLHIYDCTPDCVCKPGYKRDSDDQCVPEHECKSIDHSDETTDYKTSDEISSGDTPSLDDKNLHKDLEEYIPSNGEHSSDEINSADDHIPSVDNRPLDNENPPNNNGNPDSILDTNKKTLLDDESSSNGNANVPIEVKIPLDEINYPDVNKNSENNNPAEGILPLDEEGLSESANPANNNDFEGDDTISDGNIPSDGENPSVNDILVDSNSLLDDISPPDGQIPLEDTNYADGNIPLDDHNPQNGEKPSDVNNSGNYDKSSIDKSPIVGEKLSDDSSSADGDNSLNEDSSNENISSDCENSSDEYSSSDVMDLADSENLSDDNEKDPACNHYETRSYYFNHFINVDSLIQYRRNVLYSNKRKIIYFQVLFHVKAYRDARILLTSKPLAVKPLYEIAIGVNKNENTELRDEVAGNVLVTVQTPGILNALEYRPFYITIYRDCQYRQTVEVGVLGYVPIIKYKAKRCLDVNYISFASWGGLNAKFKYNCTDIDTQNVHKIVNYYCDQKYNEEYDECGRQCEKRCQGVLKNKYREICEGPCIPGCRCMDGYRRDKYNRCIPEYKCPSLLRCPTHLNEKYSKCGSICDAYCDDPSRERCQKLSKEKLANWHNLDRIDKCYPGCVCTNGYMRNRHGICVLPEECDNHRKQPEENKEHIKEQNEKGLLDLLSDLYESVISVVS